MPDEKPAANRSLDEMTAEAAAHLDKVRIAATEAESLRASVASAADAAKSATAQLSDVSSAAQTASTQIAHEQGLITAKATQVQEAHDHAGKVRIELDRIQTAASQHATDIEGLQKRAQSATDKTTELLSEVQAERTTVEADAKAIESLRDESKTAADIAKSLADKSSTIEERIAGYENSLAELATEARTQLEAITGLLPGATAAGLASAFHDRRQTFLEPVKRWQWLFIGSIVVIVGVATSGLWQFRGLEVVPEWNAIIRLWLMRLPILGALTWLALYASREAALAKRLEEDYGYKATIAASFQGFQEQMKKISDAATATTPLAQLSRDTLAIITSPPGRIYDKHRLTVTPVSEAVAAANQVVGTGKAKKNQGASDAS